MDSKISQNGQLTPVNLTSSMRLINSNPGSLMTNPEREMGRKARNPEAASASDEEY
jgi:hypothetical protein